MYFTGTRRPSTIAILVKVQISHPVSDRGWPSESNIDRIVAGKVTNETLGLSGLIEKGHSDLETSCGTLKYVR